MSHRPRVYLSTPLLPEAMAELTQRFQLQSHAIEACDAAVVTLKDPFPADFFTQLPSQSPLKIIANYAVGHDNIDLEAAHRRGIWVTNTPDVLTEATAELTLALLLSVSRRILEGDRLIREGHWAGWEPTQLLGRGIQGKRLGLVGAGRIGQAFGHLAHRLGMSILYTSRQAKPDFEAQTQAKYVSLDTLCSQADVISIHLSGGPETHHFLKSQHFALMKPSAYLMNTGRGNVIDESALVQHLQAGLLAGAGLDVFEHEPEMSETLKGLPNVVLTPHIGSATHEARLAMARLCWQNIEAVLSGEHPPQALFSLP